MKNSFGLPCSAGQLVGLNFSMIGRIGTSLRSFARMNPSLPWLMRTTTEDASSDENPSINLSILSSISCKVYNVDNWELNHQKINHNHNIEGKKIKKQIINIHKEVVVLRYSHKLG